MLIVEDVIDTDNADLSKGVLYRYQYSNHLGSVSLEMTGDSSNSQIIFYEEYHPYGTTAYQARNASVRAAKRYRYTGMERDEETGLSYHTARYYLPWLGRWCSTDSIGIKGGINLFCYAQTNPICLNDVVGTDPVDRTPAGIVDRTENLLQNRFSRADFEGALAESQGYQIPRPGRQGGGWYDHYEDVQQGVNQARNILKDIQSILKDAGTGNRVRRSLEQIRVVIGERLRLARRVIAVADELRNSHPTRLAGVQGRRGPLVSERLRSLGTSLLPNGTIAPSLGIEGESFSQEVAVVTRPSVRRELSLLRDHATRATQPAASVSRTPNPRSSGGSGSSAEGGGRTGGTGGTGRSSGVMRFLSSAGTYIAAPLAVLDASGLASFLSGSQSRYSPTPFTTFSTTPAGFPEGTRVYDVFDSNLRTGTIHLDRNGESYIDWDNTPYVDLDYGHGPTL
ncbi:MAG: hypothetical protein HC769_22345 [Cyanobacteria bacterium CRU_2_1]|nr:hypothetical protein [Cyanobacteria bacterium RU_5_0]NJR61330.1 hypothetical protein [Cyanobacteria bacterium CRU_2_1]